MRVHCRYTVDVAIRLPDDSDPQTAGQVASLFPAGPQKDRLIAFHQAAKAIKADAENLSEIERVRVKWHICKGHTPGEVSSCGPEHEVE